MWRKTKFCVMAFSLLALCLCWPCAGGCSPSPQYTITEEELTALEDHSNALMQNISELERLLTASNLDLTTASTALAESQIEIAQLQNQLSGLKAQMQTLSESLTIANAELQDARKSFAASERERDKIDGRLRTQRNIWEALFFVAAGVAAAR